MDADHQKSAFASKRGVPKCPFGELYVLQFQTDDFFKTKFCGKQEVLFVVIYICIALFRITISDIEIVDCSLSHIIRECLPVFRNGVSQIVG